MRKHIVAFLMALMMFVLSSVATYAGDSVNVSYLNRDIVINGESIINYQSAHPYFIFNNIIYVPLTDENCKIFGLAKKIDNLGNITLTKTQPTQKNYTERWVKNNLPTLIALPSGKTVTIIKETKISDEENTNTEAMDLGLASLVANEQKVVKENITLSPENTNGMPVLEFGSQVYIPLSYSVLYKYLEWDMYFDNYTGVYLSTDSKATAASMMNYTMSEYNKDLANYISQVNPSYTKTAAVDMLFLIKQKSAIFKVDELIVMAMIQKESTEILRQYFINHPQSIDKYTFLQNSAFTHWVKEKCSKMC